MFLTETTVDAETAQPIDGTKMLVDDGCDLGVNDAVAVVEAATASLTAMKALMACASWFLKASTFSTAAARSAISRSSR